MVLSKALLSIRPSLLDERRAGLVAEAVIAEGAVGLARRPVVELQKQIVTQASRNVNVNSSGSHIEAGACCHPHKSCRCKHLPCLDLSAKPFPCFTSLSLLVTNVRMNNSRTGGVYFVIPWPLVLS